MSAEGSEQDRTKNSQKNSIEFTDSIQLTPEGTKIFLDAIENPPEPSEALKRLARDRSLTDKINHMYPDWPELEDEDDKFIEVYKRYYAKKLQASEAHLDERGLRKSQEAGSNPARSSDTVNEEKGNDISTEDRRNGKVQGSKE